MYEESVIGLMEARSAMNMMLDEALKQPERPVAIAVVDNRGSLVEFARMDGCRILPQQLAFKKAYTAAVMRNDTSAVAERFKTTGRSIRDMGDPDLVAVQGGVMIFNSTTDMFLGGIGVSGLAAEEDEALALLGVKSIFS
jgi:glc operon protein GlcG